MVFYGYLSIILAVTAFIILTEKILIKYIRGEYCRKILHIATIFVLPLAEVFFGRGSIHFVIVCALFSVVTLLLHLTSTLKTVESRKNRYPGIFYYSISLLILSLISYFYKSLSVYFGVAFIALAMGDGFATLFGTCIKSVKIYKNKTLAGFIACIVATFISLIVYSWLNTSFLSITQIVVLSVMVAIIELVDLGLDNIVIPLVTFFVAYYISISSTVLIAVSIFVAVFFIGYFLKIMEYYAALMSGVIGFLFYCFGGANYLLFVITCYIIMFAVNIIGKILKNDLSSVVKKTGKKDFIEIFVNGAWSVLAIILFIIFKNKTFMAISLVTISAGFVDSLASDVGTLSTKKPYDFIKRTSVEKGVSGGITLMGSVASYVGSLVFAIGVKFICNYSVGAIFIMSAIMYVGSLVDSILGSLIQAKFKCNVCGKVTEKEEHCNVMTTLVGGVKRANNDVVNLLAGFSVFVLSFVLFIL